MTGWIFNWAVCCFLSHIRELCSVCVCAYMRMYVPVILIVLRTPAVLTGTWASIGNYWNVTEVGTWLSPEFKNVGTGTKMVSCSRTLQLLANPEHLTLCHLCFSPCANPHLLFSSPLLLPLPVCRIQQLQQLLQDTTSSNSDSSSSSSSSSDHHRSKKRRKRKDKKKKDKKKKKRKRKHKSSKTSDCTDSDWVLGNDRLSTVLVYRAH